MNSAIQVTRNSETNPFFRLEITLYFRIHLFDYPLEIAVKSSSKNKLLIYSFPRWKYLKNVQYNVRYVLSTTRLHLSMIKQSVKVT